MLDFFNGRLLLGELRLHLSELLITLVDLFLGIFIFRLVLIQLGFILAVLLFELGKALLLCLYLSIDLLLGSFESEVLLPRSIILVGGILDVLFFELQNELD
jgi:hypothetical protein